MANQIDDIAHHEYDNISDSIKNDEKIIEQYQSNDKYQTRSTNKDFMPEQGSIEIIKYNEKKIETGQINERSINTEAITECNCIKMIMDNEKPINKDKILKRLDENKFNPNLIRVIIVASLGFFTV